MLSVDPVATYVKHRAVTTFQTVQRRFVVHRLHCHIEIAVPLITIGVVDHNKVNLGDDVGATRAGSASHFLGIDFAFRVTYRQCGRTETAARSTRLCHGLLDLTRWAVQGVASPT